MKRGTSFECECAWKSDASREIMDIYTDEINERILRVANEYQGFDGFGVSVDSLLVDVDLGEWSVEHVSRVDCFHPTKEVHEKMSRYVWNNLFLKRNERGSFDVSKEVEYYSPGVNDTIKVG